MSPARRNSILLAAATLLLITGGGFGVYRWLWANRGSAPGNPESVPWFVDATEELGIDFVHKSGDPKAFWMPQNHGSGVAILDFDADGRPDLYFLNLDGKSPNRLYRNMPDGRFVDATSESGLGIVGANTGVIVGDIDNDGRPDVIVTQVNGVRLLHNEGGGRFADITSNSGLRNPLWAASANLFDYDRDGWLDLVVVNYLEYNPTQLCYAINGQRDYCGPNEFPGTVSKLFRNRGSERGERFEDVTIKAGLARARGPGLGVYCMDYTGDGWPDIFIANDNRPNHLWINQRNGTFLEEALVRGIAYDGMGAALAGMGVAAGDVDGDGMVDLYVTHLASERNTLWKQGPNRGHFIDWTTQARLTESHWRATGFGTLFRDFDQDGWLDIAVANGAVARGTLTPNPELPGHLATYAEHNQLFRNLGLGQFEDISKANLPFCGTPRIARSIASADFDGDGGLDLAVSFVVDRARIYRNVIPNRGHWLQVQTIDPRLNRDAYGAEVTLVAEQKRFLRIINPGDGFQSSNDPRAHFGLGAASRYDSIEVLWPDGLFERFLGGNADRQIILRRGEGQKVVQTPRKSEQPLERKP